MRSFYYIVLFQLYEYAEKTSTPKLNLYLNLTVLEMLHLLIIVLLFKIIGFSIDIPQGKLFSAIVVAILTFLNYKFFTTERINAVVSFIECKSVPQRTSRIYFFGYIILIFVVLVIETAIYQKLYKQ